MAYFSQQKLRSALHEDTIESFSRQKLKWSNLTYLHLQARRPFSKS